MKHEAQYMEMLAAIAGLDLEAQASLLLTALVVETALASDTGMEFNARIKEIRKALAVGVKRAKYEEAARWQKNAARDWHRITDDDA